MATTKQRASARGKQQPAAPAAPKEPVISRAKAAELLDSGTVSDETLADEYLADLVYYALLEWGEPAKVSEITLEINNPRITFPVVRRILNDSPRFLSAERLWTLASRYMDRSHPTERNLREAIEAAGRTLTTSQLANELSVIYDRPSDIYLQLVPKVIRAATYFRTPSNEVGLTSWLPLTDADELEDVLFDNDLTPTALAKYEAAGKKADWSPAKYAEATRAVTEAMNGQPVPHRVAGVLAWIALREKYDPLKHLLACLSDPGLVWLSNPRGGRWITRAHADRLETILEERGVALAGEEPEPETAAAAAPAPVAIAEPVAADAAVAAPEDEAAAAAAPVAAEEAPAPAEAPPLEITGDDLQALERIIIERGGPVDATELLALQYEVVPGDPSYRADVQTLEERLRGDERFQYVGAGRFREPNSLPLFVFDVPEYLTFPDLQFVSLEGEIMDEEIADEGFAGNLAREIINPLAQDVLDDEGTYTGPEPEDPGRIRLVVKAHHKEIGTFPLAQVPDDFFPTDADVVDVAIRDASGQAHDVVVNHDLRLMFNLFGLYENLPADSGAVFFLSRTPRPWEYRFEAAPEGEETDPHVYVSPARMEELIALREQAEESGDVATFDIACEVLAHYPKGLDFVQALTEVNIVRRVTRRKLASILSNYYCFVQKPGQNLWRFDAKKRDLGTDRAKRKYIKR